MNASGKEETGTRRKFWKYVVGGNPTPLARARHGNKRCWDEQKSLKLVFGIHLRDQHEGSLFFEGPIHVDVSFFMPLPKSRTKKEPDTPHHIKPDLSNLVKFVEDVGSGILYKDDSIIASMNARKQYSENPRTEITIVQL